MFGKKDKVKPKVQKTKGKTTGLLRGGLKFEGAKRSLALCVVSLFLLYASVSLYTDLGGYIGASLSAFLLSAAGGAVIVPLLFLLYICVLKLFYADIPSFLRQTAAVFCVYILAALTLGLNNIVYGADNSLRWLAPGRFGLFISSFLFESLGAFGTFLFAVILIYAVMLLCKIHLNISIKIPKFKKEKEEHKEPLDEDTVPESDEKPSAPNIIYCEKDEYFTDDTAVLPSDTQKTQEDYDNDDDLDDTEDDDVSVLSYDLKDFQIADNVIKKRGKKPEVSVTILDPEFNLEEKNSRVKQGVFPPPDEIFGKEESRDGEMNEEKARPLGDKIIKALDEFGIEANLAEILVGPTVIQFRIQLAPGIKVSKVAALANDITLAMSVPSTRIEAPIPGKPYVGIEIPNPKRRGIPIRTVVSDPLYRHTKCILPLPFGVAVNGDPMIVGLEELPHLLVAGTTGSGKSVFVNACIVGLCSMRTPDELRMILVDPKRVEMAVYENLPHLLTPPVTDAKKAVHVLAWAIREMEKRYTMFARSRVRNLLGFNEKVIPKDRLPHIVIVVDELADLMMTAPKEVEEYICRLAQMARATGIHLMLATQRPSVNVITGLIKANIPARVAFTLPSIADSRTIIDGGGADKLLGKGDMLFLSTKHPKPIRIQSPWVDENVLTDWLAYMGNLFGAPDFIEIDATAESASGAQGDTVYDDEMLEEAIETVMSTGIASASGLQRRLRVGFSRASRLIDMMEQLGVVGAQDGARPREILVDEETAKEMLDDARDS